MNYIHTETLQVRSIGEVRMARPDMSIPDGADLSDIGYAPLRETEPPSAPPGSRVEPAPPVEEGGEWRQAWAVVALTQQEIDDARRALVPPRVSRRQARRALAIAGLLDLVQPAIDAIADPLERQMAQIDWDDSQEFERTWPLLLSIGQTLGLTEQDKDELFIQAGAM